TCGFRMAIQLLVFVIIYIIYSLSGDYDLSIGAVIGLVPVALLVCTGFAFGAGLIISVLTAKYRDLESITQFVLRLFMFAAPVVYPSTIIPENLRLLFWLNPLTPAIETFRYAFFGSPAASWPYLSLSMVTVFILVLAGLMVFKQNEIKVMDTV